MTKELFGNCLGVLFERNEMDKFWDIWHRYPEFIQDWNTEFERDMATPNSELRKEHDAWWSNLRKKLVDSFGEEWVKENCKGEV